MQDELVDDVFSSDSEKSSLIYQIVTVFVVNWKEDFIMTVSLTTYVNQNLTATEPEKEKVISVLYRMFGFGVISEEELLRNVGLLRKKISVCEPK